MGAEESASSSKTSRLLIIGVLVVIGVIWIVLVARAMLPQLRVSEEPGRAILADGDDRCVVCHRRTLPGIVGTDTASVPSPAEVRCVNCHQVPADYPGAVGVEPRRCCGSPTTAMCQHCRTWKSLSTCRPAYSASHVAYAGTGSLSADHLAQYASIPEGSLRTRQEPQCPLRPGRTGESPSRLPTCHNVDCPREDGSVGECQACHLRHTFSLEQARKPETCNACHIGPDHPQWEIYQNRRTAFPTPRAVIPGIGRPSPEP